MDYDGAGLSPKDLGIVPFIDASQSFAIVGQRQREPYYLSSRRAWSLIEPGNTHFLQPGQAKSPYIADKAGIRDTGKGDMEIGLWDGETGTGDDTGEIVATAIGATFLGENTKFEQRVSKSLQEGLARQRQLVNRGRHGGSVAATFLHASPALFGSGWAVDTINQGTNTAVAIAPNGRIIELNPDHDVYTQVNVGGYLQFAGEKPHPVGLQEAIKTRHKVSVPKGSILLVTTDGYQPFPPDTLSMIAQHAKDRDRAAIVTLTQQYRNKHDDGGIVLAHLD